MNNISFTPDLSFELSEAVAPPSPAILNIPTWYKDTNLRIGGEQRDGLSDGNTQSPNTTVKGCSPFLDAFGFGYIYTLPLDVEIRDNGKGYDFNWRAKGDFLTMHDRSQAPLTPPAMGGEKEIVKWMNAFFIKTPPGYSCLFTHPLNRNELPFRTFSGVVDTDSYNLPVHFPFQLVSKEKNFIIEKGTPICQIIPFKREDWKSSIEKPNHKEQEYMGFELVSKISRSYKTQYWKKKKFQ